MRFNRFVLWLLVIPLLFTCISCKSKKETSKEKKELNLYVDIKDKHSVDILKFLLEEYKKKDPDTEIKTNDVLGNSDTIVQDIQKGSKADIILTDRRNMIELARKGLLAEQSSIMDKQKLNEKYYNILGSYGRFQDRNYGIGVIPFAVEVLYNKDALRKMGVNPPANLKDLGNIIKRQSSETNKIPVVLTEDLDMYSVLASIVASNKIKIQSLENSFDSGNEQYKNMKEMQGIFDEVGNLIKEANINKNTFEVGNETTFDNFTKGSIPLLVTVSYYNNKFKDAKNIDILDDYSMSNTGKDSIPVIVNMIMCSPTSAKNKEAIDKFMTFAFSEDFQTKLAKKGFATGFKKANEKAAGIDKKIAQRLAIDSDNNVLFIYNLPKKFQNAISSKVEGMFSGKRSGKEWEEVVDEVYKK